MAECGKCGGVDEEDGPGVRLSCPCLVAAVPWVLKPRWVRRVSMRGDSYLVRAEGERES